MLSACIRLACEIFQVSKDVSVDAVDTSPNLGATIVLKTVEMAIWRKKRRTTWTELERVLSLDLFSLTFKTYSYGPLTGAIAPIAPHGSVTDCVSVRASRVHADNIWLSSRLRVFDFMVQNQWRSHKFSTGSASVCCIHFLTTASK